VSDLYICSAVNLKDHTTGRVRFWGVHSKAALALHEDGSATLYYLTDKPVQPGQAPFAPSHSNVRYSLRI
jgi:hypothetical protein